MCNITCPLRLRKISYASPAGHYVILPILPDLTVVCILSEDN